MHQPCRDKGGQTRAAIDRELGDPLLLDWKTVNGPISGYEESPQYADVFGYSRRDFATEFGLDGHLKRGTPRVVTSNGKRSSEFYSPDWRSYRGKLLPMIW